MEYLIQIEPYSLESLRSGTPVESDVPPQVKDIRSFSITVGTKTLPQESAPATAPAPPPSPEPGRSAAPTFSDPRLAPSPALSAPTMPPSDTKPAPRLPSLPDISPLPLPGRGEKKPADVKPADKSASSSLWQTGPSSKPDPAAQPPALLPDPSALARTEQQAAYLQATPPQQPAAFPSSTSTQTTSVTSQAGTAQGSWFWPFAFTLMALAGSLGLNGFLGWSLHEARRRYRELLDYRKSRGQPVPVDAEMPESALDDAEQKEEVEDEEEEAEQDSAEEEWEEEEPQQRHGGKHRDPKRR
jgi:hypothetical protein